MPKRKQEFASEPEEKLVEVWDARKIIAGLVILALLVVGGIVGKRILFHESLGPETFIPHLPSVKGISTFNAPENATHVNISLPSTQDVQNQVQSIQQEVTHINLQEIASSSPQVKAVLQQIQDLPKEGTSQVQEACVRLCNNL